MYPDNNAQTRASAGLTETFAAFEGKLAGWLTRAGEPEHEAGPPRSEPDIALSFEERLNRLQTYLDEAEAKAEQALAPLTTEIQSLRQWLDALNMARGKMVERTAGAA
jgi:hypothetical protein